MNKKLYDSCLICTSFGMGKARNEGDMMPYLRSRGIESS